MSQHDQAGLWGLRHVGQGGWRHVPSTKTLLMLQLGKMLISYYAVSKMFGKRLELGDAG